MAFFDKCLRLFEQFTPALPRYLPAGFPQAKATHMTIQCQDCRMTTKLVVNPGMGGVTLPRQCTLNQNNLRNEEPCKLDPFVVVAQKSTFVDQQTLKLQVRQQTQSSWDSNLEGP